MKYILEIPAKDLIFLYKPMGDRRIHKELDRFHGDLDSEVPIEEQSTARYIISTTSSIGVGLTLAEAISVGFLEPDYHADNIKQGFARHCRQGNKNIEHGVESWMFVIEGNTVEERIQEVNKLREQILESATRKVANIRAVCDERMEEYYV